MIDPTSDRNLPNKLKRKPVVGFRADAEVGFYLNNVINKSEFINRAINFFIIMLKNPESLLKEMKRRDPALYKYIGRKRYD